MKIDCPFGSEAGAATASMGRPPVGSAPRAGQEDEDLVITWYQWGLLVNISERSPLCCHFCTTLDEPFPLAEGSRLEHLGPCIHTSAGGSHQAPRASLHVAAHNRIECN